MLQCIPVLDISNGVVVHAIKGLRHKYLPINSKLCASSDPLEIIRCFLELYNFKVFYIADLDAIGNKGTNEKVIYSILNSFPELEIWLDTGINLLSLYLDNNSISSTRLILSSESLDSLDTYLNLKNKYSNHQFILSLDFKFDQILGLEKLLHVTSHWTTDIIVLSLDSVGTERGINMPKSVENKLFNNFNIFYGGGVKDGNDLIALKTMGACGVLLSTALHQKLIQQKDLQAINE